MTTIAIIFFALCTLVLGAYVIGLFVNAFTRK